MKFSEICENALKEFPEELRNNLSTVGMDGFVVGLKTRNWSFF